ncbi:NUDIX hydrolase [candidate division KSB1 bacterium]|nr:NUDIX hydrolase [candidate division KSB1 bacterium]
MREYPNFPLVGVGVVVKRGNKILLIKRGRPPLKGIWTVPGGLLKIGESLEQCVQRELDEECGIKVSDLKLIDVFEYIEKDNKDIKYHYIIVEYFAKYKYGALKAQSDAEQARWINLEELDVIVTTEETKALIKKVEM